VVRHRHWGQHFLRRHEVSRAMLLKPLALYTIMQEYVDPNVVKHGKVVMFWSAEDKEREL